jgi:hypothetical protein
MGKTRKIGTDMKTQWIDLWVRADNKPNPAVYRINRELATITHFTNNWIPWVTLFSTHYPPYQILAGTQ